jgi:hypothetical protein
MATQPKYVFYTYGRYGGQEFYTDTRSVKKVVDKLIRELEEEQFEEPDDEHTEVSLTRGHWAIIVRVSGEVALSDDYWITGHESDKPRDCLYMRDVPREQLEKLMCALATGDLETVFDAPWVQEHRLPPYKRDFYRK